jgi:hypothetical protein
MAASVDIARWWGASGSITKSIITTINTRANALDQHTTADTTSPVQIPASGTGYSWWVNTRLTIQAGGNLPTTQIANLRWYPSSTSNNMGNGVSALIGQVTMTNNSNTGYVQATGSTGLGTQLLAANYAGLTPATPLDAWTYGVGPSPSPLTVGGSAVMAFTAPYDFGNMVVYQVTVPYSALPGGTTQTTWVWKYDEN